MKRLCQRLSPVVALLLLAGCATTPPSGQAGKTSHGHPGVKVHASATTRHQFARALADIRSDNLDDAIATLETLAKKQPGLAAVHNNLGIAYRRKGQFKKARTAYQAALKANPDSRNAHLNLGILYDVYLQQPAKAISQYRRYQKLGDKPDQKVASWIADLEQR